MKIEQQLTNAVIEAVKALYGQDITAAQVALQKTKKEFEGHLTLVVFGLLRISHKKPEDTAQELVNGSKTTPPCCKALMW